jgi:hypothetical protein
MAELTYKCAVRTDHQMRKLPIEPAVPPVCCGKPMIKVQAPPTQTAPQAGAPARPAATAAQPSQVKK